MAPEARAPDIRVVEEDGLRYPADVLVLKYAQALHGLDREVVRRLGVDERRLPPPGAALLLPEGSGVAARSVLVIGVPRLRDFSYPEIRSFGYEALERVASAVPEASEIALTLHGPGFGLDEVECFGAEVGGVLDAIRDAAVPRGLRTVTFVEINHSRADRMREHLEQTIGRARPAGAEPRRFAAGQSARPMDVEHAGTVKPHAFVAMPFVASLEDRFHYGISRAVRQNGLLCERIDQQAFTGEVMERLKAQIRSAKLVVADLTDANPNVALEVGFAWGCNVPTVLVCPEGTDLKFDVQGQRCLYFASIRDLEEKLGNELAKLLPTL